MIWGLVGLGVVYWLLRDEKIKQEEENLPEPGGIPTPDPSTTKWTETASWSGEYIATGPRGENVVWVFQKGIRYQDGRAEFGQSYIVIGDKNHHNFYRSNSDRGTTDIKWEFTGNPDKRDSKNVIVFSSLEEASKKADELSNPTDDGSGPVGGPESQPEPEDKPSPPPLPTRPEYGLGGGTGSLFGGGF